jgi:hypothetical protein
MVIGVFGPAADDARSPHLTQRRRKARAAASRPVNLFLWRSNSTKP